MLDPQARRTTSFVAAAVLLTVAVMSPSSAISGGTWQDASIQTDEEYDDGTAATSIGAATIADLAGPAPTFVTASTSAGDVLLLKLARAHLTAGTLQWAAGFPGESANVVVAYSAVSTYKGCPVEPAWHTFDHQVHDFADDVLIDVCHMGQWRAGDMGAPLAGTPAPEPLPMYPVRILDDGTILVRA